MGYSSWSPKELAMTKQLTHTHTHTHIYEERDLYKYGYTNICVYMQTNNKHKMKSITHSRNGLIIKENLFSLLFSFVIYSVLVLPLPLDEKP